MPVPGVMLAMCLCRTLRVPPQPLHVMHIGHISLDVGATGFDVVRVELAPARGGFKLLLQAVAYRVGEQYSPLLARAALERFVRGRNRRAEIAAGRL